MRALRCLVVEQLPFVRIGTVPRHRRTRARVATRPSALVAPRPAAMTATRAAPTRAVATPRPVATLEAIVVTAPAIHTAAASTAATALPA